MISGLAGGETDSVFAYNHVLRNYPNRKGVERDDLTSSTFSAPCFSATHRRDMTTKMVTAGPWTPALMVSSIISSTARLDSPSRLQQVVSGLK